MEQDIHSVPYTIHALKTILLIRSTKFSGLPATAPSISYYAPDALRTWDFYARVEYLTQCYTTHCYYSHFFSNQESDRLFWQEQVDKYDSKIHRDFQSSDDYRAAQAAYQHNSVK